MLDRIYHILLRLLPRRFDKEDRLEMWDTYRDRVDATERNGGRGAAARLRKREMVDLLRAFVPGHSPRLALDGVRQDLRFGGRSLSRSPLASLLAILSLALGVGATSAVFSVLDVWLLRPLPFPNDARLVAVGMANFERGWQYNPLSVPDWVDWQRESTLVDLGAYRQTSFNFATTDQVERAAAIEVSYNLPDVLGIQPRVGRTFTPQEGTSAGPRVVLLADHFWKDALGADEGIVGRSVVLDGIPHRVIGILPPGADIPGSESDVWVPLRVSGQESRSANSLGGIGLLAEDTTLAAARDELDAAAARVALLDPERTFPDASVVPLRERLYGEELQQGSVVLAGAVAFVLLIACVNIANLLLARGLGRSHEIAVRGALGARRGRIVRQLLTESLLIAAAGSVVGLGFAHLGLRLLVGYVLMPANVPGWEHMAIDGRALAAAAALAVISTLIFGLLPALRTSGVDLRERLAEGTRGGGGRRRGRLATALVVGEVALSMALLAACGLLIRELSAMHSRDMGMRTENALVFRVSLPSRSAAGATEIVAFFDALSEKIAAIPGVTGVTASSGHPISSWSTVLYSVPGSERSDGADRLSAESRRVTPSYRGVMGLEMVAGRWFDAATDVAGGEPVAVVSRSLAELWWAGPEDAVGREIDNGVRRRIVGVVEAGRLRGPRAEPPPVIFEPFAQDPSRSAFFVAAHAPGIADLAQQVRTALREMDASLAVIRPQTIEAAFGDALAGQKAGLQVLGVLGGLALVLTLVGVYGVMAQAVGQRTREIGLRVALGASTSGVTCLVMRRSLAVATVGTIFGAGLGLLAGQAMSFLLAGVSPRDPLTLAAVTALLFVVVLAASYLPARRASRLDPVRVLGGE